MPKLLPLSSMIILNSHSFSLVSPVLPSSFRFPSFSTRPNSVRASMEQPKPGFPYIPPANRDLMLNLLAVVHDRLGLALLPSTVSPDVLHFQNSHGSAHGSVDIRYGSETSPIDFILQSSLNCKTPNGGVVSIAALFSFLNSSTDAPHFLLELIQGSPTSLVLILDLLPRKDLVLHHDYLDEFYQQTDLDGPRRQLESLTQVSPYHSPSLFIRSIFSPTAVTININSGKKAEATGMEEIVAVHIGGAAKKVIGVWLEKCAVARGLRMGEGEKVELERRDGLIKRKAIEIDLAANLPTMFVPEASELVLAEIKKAFRV